MKKTIIIFLSCILGFLSCQKDSLELTNPNEQGPEALETESGIMRFAYGVYRPMRASFYDVDVEDYYYVWFVLTDHNCMGDATTVSAGNFGWRWANQTSRIILSDGTVLTPPDGGTQAHELNVRNARDWQSDNVQAHEWVPMYSLIGHCNFLIKALDNCNFSGTAEEITLKKNILKIWTYWWKGFAYSRVGSIYKQGVIVDTYGETNNNFVDNHAIIAEAQRNFSEAKALLQNIPDGNATYQNILDNLIPNAFKAGTGGVPTPQEFIKNINTYMARNILVNKYASELTSADLTEIENLVNNGIGDGDVIFNIKSADSECFIFRTTWSPYRMLVGWENLSERLVQDFKEGDARYTRNVRTLENPIVNPRGRGFQYGTRYSLFPIESGGDYVSLISGLAEIPFAGTYEENELMLAEVKIRRGEIDLGLAHIDNVRNYQNAQLPQVSGTGLNMEQALEELRRERRIGLFLKGVSFYDARRWEILKPLEQGGGRTNAVVVLQGGIPDAATIEYNYKEWWDVPANESDFNNIVTGTSSHANPNSVTLN